MSTRIHQKVLLAPPLISVAESITRVSSDEETVIKSRNGMLLYFLAGEAMLSINGEPASVVREGSVAISPGPGSRAYSLVGESTTPLHFYGISYLCNPASPTRRAHQHQKELHQIIKKAFTRPAILADATSAQLRQRLLALRNALDDRDPGAAVLLYTAALEICVETARLVLDRQSWQEAGPGRRKSRSLVNTALEFMLRNLKHNPNVERVAWSVRVTSEHLCRVFRKELGTTPRDALRSMQIDTAKSLLINSPIEIYRVAEQAGFASVTAFGRYFKTAAGMTPTEYRAAHTGRFVRQSLAMGSINSMADPTTSRSSPPRKQATPPKGS